MLPVLRVEEKKKGADRASLQHFPMAARPCSFTSPAPYQYSFEAQPTDFPYHYGYLTHIHEKRPWHT